MQKTENTYFVTDAKGYYAILGVTPNASDDEIKSNYYQKAKEWHPDHNFQENALEIFQKISVAYDVLKDENSRLKYDLFSQAYGADKFPDLSSLKIYQNQEKQDDAFIRVIRQTKIFGQGVKYTLTNEPEICNYKEAQRYILKVSLLNFLLGWWNPKSFILNIKALMSNYHNINNNRENFTLLMHNAYAYLQDKKEEMAYLSATQALDYANDNQQQMLKKLLFSLKSGSNTAIPNWNFNRLQKIQLIIPVLILLFLISSFTPKFISSVDLEKRYINTGEIEYYQEVKFNTGGRTVDDVVVSKILNIPVNIDDLNKLYYLTQDVNVMYGPSENFDLLKRLKTKTTVRLTGYTPNKEWARIMIDDGEMGFIPMNVLKSGIGKEIPDSSRIISH